MMIYIGGVKVCECFAEIVAVLRRGADRKRMCWSIRTERWAGGFGG